MRRTILFVSIALLFLNGCGEPRFWELQAPDYFGPDDYMGHSVAIDGDVAVVGAINMQTRKRCAVVYRYSWGRWEIDTVLEMDESISSFIPGYANIEVLADTIAVKSMDGVYIYRSTGGKWVKEAYISDSMLKATQVDLFSVDTNVVAIGAMNKDHSTSIHLVTRSAGEWLPTEVIQADGLGQLGAIALRGDLLVHQSAKLEDGTETVTVLRRHPDGEWIQEQVLEADPGRSGFGAKIQIEDGRVYVKNKWKCFVQEYSRDDGIWRETITRAYHTATRKCGSTFAVAGNTMVFGESNMSAPVDEKTSVNGSGAIRVFRRDEQGWTPRALVFEDHPVSLQSFGFDVDLDHHNNRAIVGTWSLTGLAATIGEMSGGLLGGGDAPREVSKLKRGATIYNLDKAR